MYIAKKIGKKPVYFYGQGVGPITGKDSQFITKYILNKLDLLSVRDNESATFLSKTLKV